MTVSYFDTDGITERARICEHVVLSLWKTLLKPFSKDSLFSSLLNLTHEHHEPIFIRIFDYKSQTKAVC